jgi:hypothetical protein
MMFPSRRLSKKIRGQGQKDVFSRTFSTNLTKLLIFLGLIKMTTGCHALESEPEKVKEVIHTIYPPGSNHTQCFNIPSGHRFAFKIRAELPHLNMVMNTKLVASVLEEHYHYMHLYEDFLTEKIWRIEFANTKRIQMHLAKSIKENCGRILTALAILGVIGKVIGYKTLVLILFAVNLIDKTDVKKPTTKQSLHNTLLYMHLESITIGCHQDLERSNTEKWEPDS